MGHVPGAWLDRFADVAFSERAREHVFRPIIADMQHEYFDAIRAKQGWFTSGSRILIPYALFVVGIGVVVRSTQVMSYRDRFTISLGAFMIASAAFYLYVCLVLVPRTEHHLPPVSLLGHAWRLGFLLAIGAVFSALIAVVSAVPGGRPVVSSTP